MKNILRKALSIFLLALLLSNCSLAVLAEGIDPSTGAVAESTPVSVLDVTEEPVTGEPMAQEVTDVATPDTTVEPTPEVIETLAPEVTSENVEIPEPETTRMPESPVESDPGATATPEDEPGKEPDVELIPAQPESTDGVELRNVPELVRKPEWTWDEEHDVLIIPYAEDDEYIELEWQYEGYAVGFDVQTAPLTESGEPGQRTDWGVTQENRMNLSVQDHLEGWYVLFIVAIIHDSTLLESTQLFCLQAVQPPDAYDDIEEMPGIAEESPTPEAPIMSDIPTLAPDPSVTPEVTAEPLPAERMAEELGMTVEDLATDLGLNVQDLYLMDEDALNELYMQVHADDYAVEPIEEPQEPYFEVDGNGWLQKYEGPGGEIVVPAGINLIMPGVFANRTDITSVILPEGLNSLFWTTFQGCTNLTHVQMPSTLTEIGGYVFDGCSSLNDISIPSSVTTINEYAFKGCSSLPSIVIPSGVSQIGSNAFANCTALTSIVINPGVTGIGEYAFYNCGKVKSIEIPSSVKDIGGYTFSNCYSLDNIVLHPGLESIGNAAFSCCAITNIEVPSSVTGMGTNVFSGCRSLKSAVISGQLTSIERFTFASCGSLEQVHLPSTVTSIGESAFYNCNSLKIFELPSGLTAMGERIFEGCSSLPDIDIPAGVTSIPYGAFINCSAITRIGMPSDVTSLAMSAFFGCSCLTDITLPPKLESIGVQAFYGCSALPSIEIPVSVTSIGSSAFSNCESLTEITIPSGVKSLNSSAFAYCENLNRVTLYDMLTSIGNGVFDFCPNVNCIIRSQNLDSVSTAEQYCVDNNVSHIKVSYDAVVGQKPASPVVHVDVEGSEMTATWEPVTGAVYYVYSLWIIGAETPLRDNIEVTGDLSIHETLGLGNSKYKLEVGAVPEYADSVKSRGFCGWGEATFEVKVFPATSIKFTRSKLTLGVGEKIQLTYTFEPEGASSVVTFGSSNKKIATVDATTGLITAKKAGTVNITAKTDNGLTAKCAVTVKVAPGKLTLDKKALTLPVGQQTKLIATLSKGSAGTLTWVSDNEGVATVDASGNVNAVAVGSANITVTAYNYNPEKPNANLIKTCVVTVEGAPATVDIDVKDVTLGVGEKLTLVPVASDADGNPVTSSTFDYVCSENGIVSVSAKGVVTAAKVGQTTVTITANKGPTVSVNVTVKAAPKTVAITNNPKKLGIGEPWTLAVKLSGQNGAESAGQMIFGSSNSKVLGVDRTTGMLNAKAAGSAKITVKTYNGKSTSITVAVSPAPQGIKLNADMLSMGVDEPNIKLTASFSNAKAYGHVTWSSDHEDIVTVSDGALTALAEGTAKVTASVYNAYGEPFTASCDVTVLAEPTPETMVLTLPKEVLGVGESMTANVSYTGNAAGACRFLSGNKKIATVSAAGVVKGIKGGEVNIIAEAYNGAKVEQTIRVIGAPTAVAITNKTTKLGVGESWQLGAKISSGKMDITNDVKYSFSSSKTSVITIEPDTGMMTAVKAGSAKITLRAYNKKSATITVTVCPAPQDIKLNTAELSMGVDEPNIKLTASFSNAKAYGHVTWSSDHEDIVTVSDGALSALAEGTAIVTASVYNADGDPFTASCNVTVKAEPTPETMVLTLPKEVLGVGESMTASISYTGNAAGACRFSSGNKKIATVSKAGVVKGVKGGNVNIIAEAYNGAKVEQTIKVIGAPTAVAITNKATKLGVGESWQLGVKISSGKTDITEYVKYSFSSSKASVVTIDPDTGMMTAVKEGSAKITLKAYNKKSATITVTVCPAPQDILLDASSLSMGVGEPDIKLTASFSNAKAYGHVIWSSDHEDIVTVSNGALNALAEGTSKVTASVYNANGEPFTASCDVTVMDEPTPETMVLTLPKQVLGVGESMTASVSYTGNAAGACKFGSGNKKIATVSAAGVVKGVKGGDVNIIAQAYNGAKVEQTIKVTGAPTAVAITNKVEVLEWGDKHQLGAKINSGKTDITEYVKYSFSSSNPEVISVDADTGMLEAVGESGSAVIKLAAYNGKSASLTVRIASVSAPELKEAVAVDGGVRISWDTYEPHKYRVFYKVGISDTWMKLKDTSATSYTWNGAKNGTTYSFTVACLSNDGKRLISVYDKVGLTLTYYDTSSPAPQSGIPEAAMAALNNVGGNLDPLEDGEYFATIYRDQPFNAQEGIYALAEIFLPYAFSEEYIGSLKVGDKLPDDLGTVMGFYNWTNDEGEVEWVMENDAGICDYGFEYIYGKWCLVGEDNRLMVYDVGYKLLLVTPQCNIYDGQYHHNYDPKPGYLYGGYPTYRLDNIYQVFDYHDMAVGDYAMEFGGIDFTLENGNVTNIYRYYEP